MSKKASNPPPTGVKPPPPPAPPRKGKTPQELGLKFQTEFQRFLEVERTHHKLEIIRLYDTHAAGSLLPAQGGDFILMFAGKGILIDTKLTTKHECLSTCLKSAASETQMSRMRLWNRAGGISWLVFQGSAGNIDAWAVDDYLLDCYYTPRTKPDPHKGIVFGFPSMAELKLHFVEFLKVILGDRK
jgi:hypothetical protein